MDVNLLHKMTIKFAEILSFYHLIRPFHSRLTFNLIYYKCLVDSSKSVE